MLPLGDWPAWGDPSTEEFRPAGRGRILARVLLPYAIPILLLGAIGVALGSIVVGPGVLAYLVGIAVAAVATGFIWNKTRRGMLSTVIRMSPVGVELRDDLGFHTRIRWAHLAAVGTTYTRSNNPAAARIGRLRYAVEAQTDLGITGWGERQIPASVPAWLRKQHAATPYDQRTGLWYVAIPLGGVDPHWVQGRMGGWVRHYRPDLLA